MDKLNNYQTLIVEILNRHADFDNRSSVEGLETHAIFDESRDRYMLFRTGWRGKERVRTAILYVKLDHDKIWIEEDWTEDGLATELLAAGVPHHDIVLAFHHPTLRSLTEFAAA